MGLPTKPRNATDRRRRDIDETVEAEAIPANFLRNLLSKKIESFINRHELSVVQVAEESEREWLESLAEKAFEEQEDDD